MRTRFKKTKVNFVTVTTEDVCCSIRNVKWNPHVMFTTAVCFLFLLKLKWPKNKTFMMLEWGSGWGGGDGEGEECKFQLPVKILSLYLRSFKFRAIYQFTKLPKGIKQSNTLLVDSFNNNTVESRSLDDHLGNRGNKPQFVEKWPLYRGRGYTKPPVLLGWNI